MLKHLQSIIAEFDSVPKRLERIVSFYLMFLILDNHKHESRAASRVFGIHESNFSRLLSNKNSREFSRTTLNRAIKRRLAKYCKLKKDIFLIIDATFTHRSGKQIENNKKFRHGGPYIEGHQFTNFVLLIDDEIIPLASVPFYSKEYCSKYGIDYQTEIEMVTSWIEMLPESGLLNKEIVESLHFLLDTGYDARCIQSAIQSINCKFTVGLRSERSVNGLGVKEYFFRYRSIPWKTIRLKVGNGGKKKESKFRVRSAGRSHLKGFGEVLVVCSEKESRNARKKSRKFIATNILNQSTRKIISIYAKRWAIETWHKKMKQKFGYGDCRSKKFSAIEAHVNFALAAFCLAGANEPNLPKQGTTIDQYQVCVEWNEAAKIINLFDGKKKLKTLSNERVARVVNM